LFDLELFLKEWHVLLLALMIKVSISDVSFLQNFALEFTCLVTSMKLVRFNVASISISFPSVLSHIAFIAHSERQDFVIRRKSFNFFLVAKLTK